MTKPTLAERFEQLFYIPKNKCRCGGEKEVNTGRCQECVENERAREREIRNRNFRWY